VATPQGKDPSGHAITPSGDLPPDSFFVHGIVERLAHASIVKGFERHVKPYVEESERRFTDALILSVLRIAIDLVRLHDGENRLFQIPLQELGKPFLQLAANAYLEHNGVQKWATFVVLVVGRQHDLLIRLPPDEFERPGSHRSEPEAIAHFSTSS
jgi:hypothetical protein